MRLIDADGLLGILNDLAEGGAGSIKISEIIYFLNYMPTRGGIPFDTPTGAVKVVRCKDCRRERYCEFTQYQGMDGYCSLAESKDGD